MCLVSCSDLEDVRHRQQWLHLSRWAQGKFCLNPVVTRGRLHCPDYTDLDPLLSRTLEAFCQKGFCNTCKTSCKDGLFATKANPTDYFCWANLSSLVFSCVPNCKCVRHQYKIMCSCFALIRSDRQDSSHVNQTRAPTLKILTIWYSIQYLSHSSHLLLQYNQVSLLNDARHVITVAETSQVAAVS